VSLIEALNDISDVIFPPRCLGCAEILHPQSGQLFCPVCKEKIKFITDNICPVCGTTFLDSPAKSHLCGNCLENKTYFSCARAVVSYETIILHAIHQFKYGSNISIGALLASFMADFSFPDVDFTDYSLIIPVPLHIKRLRQRRAVVSYETIILHAIHQFKYGSNISIGALLASFMADFSFPDVDFTDYSLIIPVPLHIKRLRQRGFNQSLILAHALAKKWQIPVNFSLLKRHKFTLTQTGLNKTERKQNIKGAFEVSNKKNIVGENVILVDDVYTTGATINECAKTLTKAGAQKVTVLTLARVLQS